MIEYKCDRCGKRIGEDDRFEVKANRSWYRNICDTRIDADLCPGCMEEFKKWIRGKEGERGV